MKGTLALMIIMAVAASIAAAADEPDKRTPVERYQGDGSYYLIACKLKLRLANARADGSVAQDENSDWIGCVKEGTSVTKKNFPAALKTVKKPKAQDALKSYHVVLVTAIDGIWPGTEERKLDYERRQQATETKLKEAWARFELEQ